MNQEYLLKIALIISLVGVFVFLLIISIEPKTKSISQVTNQSINERVKIQGKITNQNKIRDFYLLTIEDNTGKINVISGKNFTIGREVEVLGKFEIYRNKPQINADRIKTI